MKKLLLGSAALVCTALLFMSVKRFHEQAYSDPSAPVIGTLNGVSLTDARTMVSNSVNHVDSMPANTQIWFSRTVIDHVCYQLEQDRRYYNQNPTAGVKNPDGIRIYFGSVTPTDSTPVHLNNRIVVVSTFDTIPSPGSAPIHKDYFSHSPKATLFRMSGIGGMITHDNNDLSGSLLYKTCNCDTVVRCLYPSNHDLTRSQAERMVQAFAGKPVNTTCEFFDIQMLENLRNEMDLESDDGIRIYFARGVVGVNKEDEIDRARFVITTTRASVIPGTTQTIHLDYFDCIRIPLGGDMVTGGNSQNNGEQCQPNCQGASLTP